MLVVTDHHPSRSVEARGTAENVDALGLERLGLRGILVVAHHEVTPLERCLGIQPAGHGLARTRRLARRLECLAGTQQGLGGHAGPVVALAADQLALDDGHLEAAADQTAGAVLSAGSRAYHDHVIGHLASSRVVSGCQATLHGAMKAVAAIAVVRHPGRRDLGDRRPSH